MSADTRVTAADTRSAEPDSADRAVLVVYEGDGADAKTRVIELPDGAQLTVGRARQAVIQIDTERVSRLHAQIRRRGPEITVEDLGSRNGTYVNGTPIAGAQRLVSGDAITIGPATIVVSLTTNVAPRPEIEGIRFLEERLAAEVDRGHQYRRTFGLVRLRIDGNAQDIDDAIDRVAAALRVMDVITEYSPSELAILLPELDAAGTAAKAREIATAARTRGGQVVPALKVAVGVAAFPEYGTTPGTLIARAGAALASVRVTGGDEVGVPPDDPSTNEGAAIVADPQMRRVYELVRKVADHPITVLIYGETGVGKEVIATELHRASQRRGAPIVRLNCASLPESLLESELFGHERGAFTGADRRKQGYFEVASGGTLFLDEIGEMTASTQSKLLRVLEARRITRVGGTDEIEVDVRVVCATNRDLEAEVARGNFRSDLFFRISAFTVLIPPLRDRAQEILLLSEHFLAQAAGAARRRPPTLSQAAANALRSYAWPGNVRELRNAIERAFVVHADGVIQLEDLPDRVREARVASTLPAAPSIALDGQRDVREQISQLERDAIAAALEACGGSQTEAAKKLGVSRRALIYRMEKHGLKPLPPAARR